MAKAQKRTSETVVWDKELPGLGLRSRDGRKTWIVQTRINGRTRKRTLGLTSEITKSEARNLARQAVDELSCGTSQRDRKLVVGALADRFLQDGAARWKPGTQHAHGNDVHYWIKPRLGAMRVVDVTRAKVLTFRDALPIGNGSKNRVTAVLIRHHAPRGTS